MRERWAGQVAEAYKKKIETIVRKPGKLEDEDEAVAPCPFCSFKSPASSLDCIQVPPCARVRASWASGEGGLFPLRLPSLFLFPPHCPLGMLRLSLTLL